MNILELSAVLQEGLHELCVFDKIEVCVLQDCNFIKTLVHRKLFLSKERLFLFLFFLRQLVFGT